MPGPETCYSFGHPRVETPHWAARCERGTRTKSTQRFAPHRSLHLVLSLAFPPLLSSLATLVMLTVSFDTTPRQETLAQDKFWSFSQVRVSRAIGLCASQNGAAKGGPRPAWRAREPGDCDLNANCSSRFWPMTPPATHSPPPVVPTVSNFATTVLYKLTNLKTRPAYTKLTRVPQLQHDSVAMPLSSSRKTFVRNSFTC